jgi:5-formyltetrahydrofolate cyclo-ligase
LATLTSTDADSKAALRREALDRRRALGADVRLAFCQRMVEEGLRLARERRARFVSAFYPIRDEPDTLPLLNALAGDGFATALPVVVDRRSPLIFRLWRPGDPTRAGPMAIPEPLESAPPVDPELLFVPLACFDRAGRRIGYGAGHYDRSLACLRQKGAAYAVGVAYGVCEVAKAPYEAHDQYLDAIVTERETIFFRER